MKVLDYGPVITLAMDNEISAAELLVVIRDHIESKRQAECWCEDDRCETRISDMKTGEIRSVQIGARVIPGGLVDQMAREKYRKELAAAHFKARLTTIFIVLSGAMIIASYLIHWIFP